jgi:hypothetical protein
MAPAVLVIILIVVLARLGPDLLEWINNNRQPVLTAPAQIVAKRSLTRGYKHVRTYYYVTVEFRNGERREYAVEGEQFGMLAEGDYGLLTFQGTWLHGFERG